MSAVILLGDFPATGVTRQIAAQRVDPKPEPQATSLFIDVVAAALRERGAVLVLYPSWRAKESERLVTLARGALLSDRIAGVPLRLPPLALSLVADQLAFVALHVKPGMLASLPQRLAEATVSGAWVRSVAHFEHVHIGLGQHVSSYLPGGGFSVVMSPRPDVHRITSSQPVQQFSQLPAAPLILLNSQEDGDTDWFHRSLSPALGASTVTSVAVQPSSSRYWGSKRYLEFVAFSGHPQALNGILRSVVCKPCRWCGEAIAAPRCPFCLMMQPTPPGVPQTAAGSGPAVASPPTAPPRTGAQPMVQPQPHPQGHQGPGQTGGQPQVAPSGAQPMVRPAQGQSGVPNRQTGAQPMVQPQPHPQGHPQGQGPGQTGGQPQVAPSGAQPMVRPAQNQPSAPHWQTGAQPQVGQPQVGQPQVGQHVHGQPVVPQGRTGAQPQMAPADPRSGETGAQPQVPPPVQGQPSAPNGQPPMPVPLSAPIPAPVPAPPPEQPPKSAPPHDGQPLQREPAGREQVSLVKEVPPADGSTPLDGEDLERTRVDPPHGTHSPQASVEGRAQNEQPDDFRTDTVTFRLPRRR
ncbi:hypothetical protein ACSNOI_25555 [Actinomadura kijaniata]|uniref:hypothetical protein n=1 Tax=Actinomadura kijaniata TaxID=46161 RepID=UPI003F199D89